MVRQADIFGLGRMGTALAHSLLRAGWTVRAFSPTVRGRGLPSAEVFEGPLPEGFVPASLLLFTVPDRSIAEAVADFAARFGFREGQVVAHASGSLGLEVLEPAAAQGAEVGSLHPLFAASPGATDLAGKWAAVDGSGKARERLESVAREIGLIPIHVPAEERARYHAAASLAANGLVSLASLASRLLLPLGLDQEEALAALLPLLRSALDGLERSGLPLGLTGPVARGDAEVVGRHLEMLAGSEAEEAYRALSLHALHLAREMGEADPAGLQDIETSLRTD